MSSAAQRARFAYLCCDPAALESAIEDARAVLGFVAEDDYYGQMRKALVDAGMEAEQAHLMVETFASLVRDYQPPTMH